MKKFSKKIISLVLCASLVFSLFGVAFTASAQEDTKAAAPETVNSDFPYLTNKQINPDEISNSVVIPGVFQSKVRLYNDDGTLAKNSDGEDFEAPFFLDSTGDIVKLALKKCLFPILLTLLTQHDFGGKCVESVSETVAEVLGGKVQSDANGNFVYNLKADYYDGSVADLRKEGRIEDIEYIYDQIPLNDYASIAGEDHLYFFSYASFGNIDSIVDQLYALILKAAKTSPTGKVNIIPISQGGSLANDLLARYPQVGEVLDRIVYIVPALDGTVLLGEIYEKGIIDDEYSLYSEVFPNLLYDDDQPWLGDLVNIALRILPNSVVNGILDGAVDCLIGDYVKYSTCMWALIPQGNYENAANKYLSKPEDEKIRKQTDAFWEGQKNSDANIMYQINTYGVEVFNIVDYNSALYPICDSWKSLNADGIIQLDSTSMGATSVAIDTPLAKDYVPVEGGKYVDKYNLVDAGTGLLPDTTFYFHNQNHESTARNDVIMKLAISLITDNNFKDINSYPDQYPEFNECRDSKFLLKDLDRAKLLDTSELSAEEASELKAVIEKTEKVLNSTNVDPDAFEKAETDFYAVYRKVTNTASEPTLKDEIDDKFNSGLAAILKFISNLLYKLLKGKGFSDILRIF